jgi:hypothetical protein
MTGAAAGAGLLSGCTSSNSTTSSTTSSSGPGQTDVLTFALNLEYLEATFYSYITQGADLPSDTTVGSGAVTGAPGAAIAFAGANAGALTDMLNEIYFDELNHVRALRSLLGILVVPRPAINLAALGAITSSNVFSIARLFEDVVVTAYTGALALSGNEALSGSSLNYAAQILGVESFHAGALRLGIILQNAATAGTDTPLKADSSDVAPFDPGTTTLAAAGPSASGAFFATYGASAGGTTAGMAYKRTTSQVLSIVYQAAGVAGTTKGGFFPSGVNGIINSV